MLYDPQFWGMAFPLAMYTTSTYQLSKALHLPFLASIPKGMVVVAFGCLYRLAGGSYWFYSSSSSLHSRSKKHEASVSVPSAVEELCFSEGVGNGDDPRSDHPSACTWVGH
nr:hypothetical protein [Paenibacillus brevis]